MSGSQDQNLGSQAIPPPFPKGFPLHPSPMVVLSLMGSRNSTPTNHPVPSATKLWALPGNRSADLREQQSDRIIQLVPAVDYPGGKTAWGRTKNRTLGKSWFNGKFGVCPSQIGPEKNPPPSPYPGS